MVWAFDIGLIRVLLRGGNGLVRLLTKSTKSELKMHGLVGDIC